VGILDPASGWLVQSALVTLLGAVVVRWVLLRRCALGRDDLDWLQARCAVLGGLASVMLLLGLGLVLVRQALEFRDPFVPLSEDLELLLGRTAWGSAWMTGIALTVAAGYGLVRATRGRAAGWMLTTLAAVLLAAYPAATGHAAGARAAHPLAIAADSLHVLAAGAWIGALLVVLVLELAWSRDHSRRRGEVLRALVPLFSPLALVAAATLLATGAYSAWIHVPALGDLARPGYGRVLLVKLLLVGAVLVAGAVNWRRLAPRLADPTAVDALSATMVVEVLLAQAVLVASAVLTRTPPPF
jgi:putative copper export protein